METGLVITVPDFINEGDKFLKNLRTGAVNEITFRPGDKFETANIETTEMQYLYAEGDQHVFMDNETYEQVSIPDDKIQDALKFLFRNTSF
ncbi:hypothetical protein H7R52_06355 [Weissella confusa]|uniref:Translation elongation factor P/YeiP central domain-containing protein n=1 Tax=Weissella confusa TaxID=1583 RepID=A0A923NEV8_WEICO|nr:hypothetical protein [Weissella confusa]